MQTRTDEVAGDVVEEVEIEWNDADVMFFERKI